MADQSTHSTAHRNHTPATSDTRPGAACGCRKPRMTIMWLRWTTLGNPIVPYSNPNIYVRYRARSRHRDSDLHAPRFHWQSRFPSDGYTHPSDCLPLFVLYTPKKDIKLYAYSSQTVWGKSIVLEIVWTCAYRSGKCAYSSKCLPKQKVFDQTIGKTIWTSSKHFFSSSQTCK
jgi:hypothetical protein